MKLGLKSRQSDSRASTEHHTASCTVCQSRVGIGVRDWVPGGNAGYQRDPGWDAEVAAERVPLLPLPPQHGIPGTVDRVPGQSVAELTLARRGVLQSEPPAPAPVPRGGQPRLRCGPAAARPPRGALSYCAARLPACPLPLFRAGPALLDHRLGCPARRR